MTCGAKLADGQWWHFCGETDMGQTLPVQCTDCGGDMIRADDPNAEARVEEMKVVWDKQNTQRKEERKRLDWELLPTPWVKTEIVRAEATTEGWQPQFIIMKATPTDTEHTERRIRKSINPFDLQLDEEKTKILSDMIHAAAVDIVKVCGGVTDRQTLEELMK